MKNHWLREKAGWVLCCTVRGTVVSTWADNAEKVATSFETLFRAAYEDRELLELRVFRNGECVAHVGIVSEEAFDNTPSMMEAVLNGQLWRIRYRSTR